MEHAMNLTPSTAVDFDAALIAKLSQQGPRYTSYPTADRFPLLTGHADYAAVVHGLGAAPTRLPLSLYLHIPFCESLCYYCACNKIITKERQGGHLPDLPQARDQHAGRFAGQRAAGRAAAPGGRHADLPVGRPDGRTDGPPARQLRLCRRRLAGEYSIEIDPRTVDAARIFSLRRQGFNRISLGVQDFDPDVQEAVNRIQPEALTLDAIRASREGGFRSISIDLIYGLPRQTLTTIAQTLAKVVAASPDRISIYNYAHMPQLFKSQRLIVDAELPGDQDKLAMLGLCIERLTAA
ncbi:radical SAM protein [Massilia sp. B-10]|nr:radical SAM protein [Massilia sp. B-10]